MAVHMTLTDIEEYSLRLNNVLDCTIYNQITVGNVTLPKAVLSTVKIFAVYGSLDILRLLMSVANPVIRRDYYLDIN